MFLDCGIGISTLVSWPPSSQHRWPPRSVERLKKKGYGTTPMYHMKLGSGKIIPLWARWYKAKLIVFVVNKWFNKWNEISPNRSIKSYLISNYGWIKVSRKKTRLWHATMHSEVCLRLFYREHGVPSQPALNKQTSLIRLKNRTKQKKAERVPGELPFDVISKVVLRCSDGKSKHTLANFRTTGS